MKKVFAGLLLSLSATSAFAECIAWESQCTSTDEYGACRSWRHVCVAWRDGETPADNDPIFSNDPTPPEDPGEVSTFVEGGLDVSPEPETDHPGATVTTVETPEESTPEPETPAGAVITTAPTDD